MASQSLTKGTNVLQKYDYGYGQIDGSGNLDTTKNNGQLATIESFNGGTTTSPTGQFVRKYEYDSIGRLKRESENRSDNGSQVYKQKFSFDRFGNRYLRSVDNPTNQNPLFPTFIEDNNIDRATNRFASNTNIVYDEAGNIVTDGKYRELNVIYDANGRMVSTIRSGLSNSVSVFDAGGRKIATKVNDIWKYSIYDAFGKRIAEYGAKASGGISGIKYVHQDIQGSTRLMTNGHGFVKTRMDYQAFGEQLPINIGPRNAEGYSSDDPIRQRYALTENDEGTGLNDTWFRKLENRAGRWTSPDPYNGSMNTGHPQSFNRYSYVSNDPVNKIDPTGLMEDGDACDFRGYESDGMPIYYGTVRGGECIANGGPPVTIPFPWWLLSNGGSVIQSFPMQVNGGGGDGEGGGNSAIIGSRFDKYWGFNDVHFRRWLHDCYKKFSDISSSAEMAEAYNAWLANGSPKNGKCGSGGSSQSDYRRDAKREKGFSDFERTPFSPVPPILPGRPTVPVLPRPGLVPAAPIPPIMIFPPGWECGILPQLCQPMVMI